MSATTKRPSHTAIILMHHLGKILKKDGGLNFIPTVDKDLVVSSYFQSLLVDVVRLTDRSRVSKGIQFPSSVIFSFDDMEISDLLRFPTDWIDKYNGTYETGVEAIAFLDINLKLLSVVDPRGQDRTGDEDGDWFESNDFETVDQHVKNNPALVAKAAYILLLSASAMAEDDLQLHHVKILRINISLFSSLDRL